MKSASSALISLLASDQFLMADLLTVTLANGAVMRLASSDIDLVYGGNTFSSKGPFFKRGTTKTKIGVEVDELALTFFADSTMTLSGQPFLQLCRAGGLDWAIVQLERTFMATWGDTSAGTVKMFYGRVASVNPGRTSADVTVKGITDLLNIQMPRNVWQSPCLNVLWDPNTCKANRANFAATGSVGASPSVNSINTTLTKPDGWFSQGSMTFSSGVLSGLSFSIKTYTQASGLIVPMNAFPSAPSPGDTFTAYPGCDHTYSGGCAKLANQANFRGMPYIPIPETAY